MQSLSFNWFGTEVRVTSDTPAFHSYIEGMFGGLSGGPAEESIDFTFELRSPEGPTATGPSGVQRLDTRGPQAHAYSHLMEDLLSRVGTHFVLHGAALAKGGKALLVCAPSTFGKTTIGIGLALRGFGLLSDDILAIDRTSGRVVPFPKALGLRSGSRRILPPRVLERAHRATRLVDGAGDWLVDPARFLGAPGEPAVPAMVVVVRPECDGTDVRRFPVMRLRFMEGREPPVTALEALAGVEEVWHEAGEPSTLGVRFSDPGSLDRFIHENRADIVFAAKLPAGEPRFEGEPVLQPIGTFQAALEMTQEMANRGRRSRLDEEYRGREPFLVADLASCLRHARCWAMSPGDLDATLERLETLFDEMSL